MSGICGVAWNDPERPVDGAMLRRMAEALRHRGPDSAGDYRAPGIGLGLRRLNSSDAQTGDQPIANEDGTIVVCDGEIYNYPQLEKDLRTGGHPLRSRSPAEVIVHLYEELGVECLGRLRGMFAFALWDGRQRSLFLARDRLGIKPLHYALGAEGLYFASELKSILATGASAREIDIQALRDLFSFGFILTPHTLLAGIRRLPPGHYLLYSGGRLSLHRYWDLRFPARDEPPDHRRPEEWVEAFRAKLDEAVRSHLPSDVPVGAWLSSGIDSSAVAALAGRQSERPLPTYTLAFEDPALDETVRWPTLDRFAGYNLAGRRTLCRNGDLARLPQALWHQEDPTATGLEVPRLLLAELAAQEVKVVLTGEGADELLGGYFWFRIDKLLRPLARLPLALRRASLLGGRLARRFPWGSRAYLAPPELGLGRYRHLVGLPCPELAERLFAPPLRAGLAGLAERDGLLVPPAECADWHPFSQLLYYEAKVRLADYILPISDRAAMACGLEVRLPFLDHELVELAARIPPSLKLRGLEEKHLLRRALRDLLPREIVRRRKRGLRAPIVGWLRGELPEFAVPLLSRQGLLAKGYFDPDAVLDLLARHRAGANYGQQLMAVLAVQLWDDLFLRHA